jgi:hypothetical protein
MRGVPTDVLAEHHWCGDDIMDGFDLTRHEALVALWFEARHGQRIWRRRWRAWAASVEGSLARADAVDLSGVDLPPVRG